MTAKAPPFPWKHSFCSYWTPFAAFAASAYTRRQFFIKTPFREVLIFKRSKSGFSPRR
jgi:hypothetical protein